MKKLFKNKVLIFAILFIVVIGGCLTALCLRQPVLENLVRANMADYRDFVYFGECQEFKANLMCGVREEPYEYNGVKNNDREFGVLTVIFAQNYDIELIEFELIVDGESCIGLLEKNPFDSSFMADVEKRFESGSEMSLKILSLEEVKLECLSSSWNISSQKALEIGIEALREDMEDFITQNRLYGECYLKIITDSSMQKFYYSFSFVGDDLKMRTVVINPEDGEVIVKNVT